jgi:hypothetical protein
VLLVAEQILGTSHVGITMMMVLSAFGSTALRRRHDWMVRGVP